MYAMWTSLTKDKDPFLVVPAFPVLHQFQEAWPHSRIRKEIFEAESADLMEVKILFYNLHLFSFLERWGTKIHSWKWSRLSH